MPDKNIEPEFCPECGGKIEYSSFEKSCIDCSLVIDGLLEILLINLIN